MEAARAGGDRQELHEAIRENAMAAYAALERGETNPLSQLLSGDERIVRYLDPAEVRSQLDPSTPRRRRPRARPPPRPAHPRHDRKITSMQKGREITRGKTKILFEADGKPELAVVQQMDAITAGDGARRNEIDGKGRIAAKTTARLFPAV